MAKKHWIQKAIKHKGSLKKFAKRHHDVKHGKIELGKLKRIKHLSTHRKKQINLARTLRRMKKK